MNKISKEKMDELFRLYEKPSIKFLVDLKLDLSINENINNIGSGLGGDPSQFFYFLTKNVKVEHSSDKNIYLCQNDNDIVFKIPPRVSIISLREELNKFWEICADKQIINAQHLLDTSFLRNYNSNKIDIQLLIKAIETAKEVVIQLDRNAQFAIDISNFFDVEIKDLEEKFLIEIGLSTDYLINIDLLENQYENMTSVNFEYDSMRSTMKKHPIWGKQLNNIHNRKNNMLDQLISEQILYKLNNIGSYPIYISAFVLRSIIGIKRIIMHDLDKKLDWLKEIDEAINRISLNYYNNSTIFH